MCSVPLVAVVSSIGNVIDRDEHWLYQHSGARPALGSICICVAVFCSVTCFFKHFLSYVVYLAIQSMLLDMEDKAKIKKQKCKKIYFATVLFIGPNIISTCNHIRAQDPFFSFAGSTLM